MLKSKTGDLPPKELTELTALFTPEVQEDWVRALSGAFELLQFHGYSVENDDGFVLLHFRSTDNDPQRGILMFVCQRGNVNMQLVFPQNGHLMTVNNVIFENVEDLPAFIATPENAIEALMQAENEEGPN